MTLIQSLTSRATKRPSSMKIGFVNSYDCLLMHNFIRSAKGETSRERRIATNARRCELQERK